MCELEETKFDGGGVKVWLKEEQEPITAQNIEQSLLLTSEEQEYGRRNQFTFLAGHYRT